MANAANQTCIGSTTDSARPSAYGRLFWLATAEFGITLPVVVKAEDTNRSSGRRYIYLEPLVRAPSRDDSTGIGQGNKSPDDDQSGRSPAAGAV